MDMLHSVRSSGIIDSNYNEDKPIASKDIKKHGKIAHQATTCENLSSIGDDIKIDNLACKFSPLRNQSGMDNSLLQAEPVSQYHRSFDVLLPLTGLVRNMYTEFLRKNQEELSFVETSDSLSPSQFANIVSAVDNLRKLCNYPSLEFSDYFKKQEYDQLYRAKYAENISTKIIFIIEFLSQMKPHGKSIVILIRRELVDLFEAIFKEQGIIYYRADRPNTVIGEVETKEIKLALIITPDEMSFIKHADVVIAFDSSHSKNYNSKEVGKSANLMNSSTILLHLIISHSVEHIEKFMETKTDILYDKLKFFKLTCTLASSVGKLPRGYPSPPDSAKSIAKYLLQGDTEALWPLPPLPDLDINSENLGREPQPTLPDLLEEISEPRYHNEFRDSTPVKHLLLSDSTEIFDSPKRRKLQSPVEVLSSDLHNIQNNMESKDNILTQLHEREEIIRNSMVHEKNLSNVKNTPESYISSLQLKVRSLESKLQKREDIETELYQVNQELQLRLSDLESSIKIIQPKLQEALNDRGLFELQKEQAVKQEKSVRFTLELREAAINKIREENTIMLKELIDARNALSNSKVPEISEFEKMRCELSTLKSDFDVQQKQKSTVDSDYEYLKSNYQTASTTATSLAQEILCQKKQIEALKIKASENAVKIHQTYRDDTISRLQLIIRGLRAEKLELERQVEKLSEQQLNACHSGRPNTRGNSVPRSPRLGACSSPRPIGRVLGSHNATIITSGNRSRGSSPLLVLENNSGYRANTSTCAETTCGISQQQRRVEKPSMKRFGTHLQ